MADCPAILAMAEGQGWDVFRMLVLAGGGVMITVHVTSKPAAEL